MKKKILHLIRTQFVAKILGILRELFIFYFFGSSAKFLVYLKYSSFAELTNIFFNPQSLITNLLPKFKRLLSDNQEKVPVLKKQAYKIAVTTFLITFLVLDVCYFAILGRKSWESIGYSMFFALLLSGLFFFNIGYIINLANGNYKRFNKGVLVSNVTLVAFAVPLSYALGIVGVLANRLISVFSHSLYTWNGKTLSRKEIVEAPTENLIRFSDFDFSVFVIGNLTYFIVIFLKVLYSIYYHDDIYFFNLASIFIIAADTLLTKSISTVFIEANPTKKSIYKVFAIVGAMYAFVYLATSPLVFDQVNLILRRYHVKDISRTAYLFHAYVPMLLSTSLLQLYYNYLRGIDNDGSTLKLGRKIVLIILAVLLVFLGLIPLLHIVNLEVWFSWILTVFLIITLGYVIKK